MAANEKLRAVLVGCGGMGRRQAMILAELAEFDLVGVCDRDEAQARQAAEQTGAKAFTDFDAMLAETRPDTVSICTPNNSHAPLTIASARFGVRGVYCEKPMATNLADARAMVAECRSRGVALVVNHQRRLGEDLLAARELIDTGAIGEVKLLRGNCAGDVLSDGTHLVDSLMWLAGDPEIEWVFGQIHRIEPEASEGGTGDEGRHRPVAPGFRYGHAIETGGLAVIQIKDGPRIELLTGDIRDPHRTYQDYEVFGTAGRLWRPGDRFSPNLFISDAKGGPWTAGLEEWNYKPVPTEGGAPGQWRPVEASANRTRDAKVPAYHRFARTILHGEDHPMSGERALRGFEIVMGVYESARTHKRLAIPLQQDRFPLEIMLEAGQL